MIFIITLPIKQYELIQNSLKKMNNDKVEIDVRDNKVKEGMLLKQSRHLKQWKQRWMVLTKTYLYSFSGKGQYKDATQIISLKEIQTMKSYYKQQYKKPHTFRIQSPQVNLHLSAKSNDQKWAWMTAIQKMIDRVIHPDTKADTYNLIRQTIKMSTAVRQTLTLQKKQQKSRKQSADFSQNLLKKLRMTLSSQTVEQNIIPQIIVRESKLPEQQQTFFIIDNKKSQSKKSNESPTKTQQNIKQEKAQGKVTQKIVEVPVQRIVQKIIRVPQIRQKIVEKIVKVPQIRQKIVQKIVYKEAPKTQINGTTSKQISSMLKQLMLNPGQNPRPLIDFVVYLLTSKLQQYQAEVLAFCLDLDSRRFFAQMFLLMMNEETDELILNSYLKFILVLYENSDQFFYSSDLKALIGILIREMEMNRSEFNQYLIMMVFQAMTQKDWWTTLNYRRNQIKTFVKQLQSISGSQNQYLASTLLENL